MRNDRSGPPEHLDDADHLGFRGLGDRRQLGDRGRTPHAARIGERVGQRLEHRARQICRRAIARSVSWYASSACMRECVSQACRSLRMPAMSMRLAGLMMLRPVVPGPHQRVLQNRQLILVVAELVQQASNESRRDLAAADRHRPGDRQPAPRRGSCAARGTGRRSPLPAGRDTRMQSPMKSDRIVSTT